MSIKNIDTWAGYDVRKCTPPEPEELTGEQEERLTEIVVDLLQNEAVMDNGWDLLDESQRDEALLYLSSTRRCLKSRPSASCAARSRNSRRPRVTRFKAPGYRHPRERRGVEAPLPGSFEHGRHPGSDRGVLPREHSHDGRRAA